MRIRVAHRMTSRYAPPAPMVIQTLRLTPRSYDGLHIVQWRVEVDHDCRLTESEDAFGNIVDTFTATGPLAHLSIRIEGLVETTDTAGVVRGSIERFPPSLFLRETDLTGADGGLRAFAREAVEGAGADVIARLHALMEAVHKAVEKASASEPVGAAKALAAGRGNVEDIAHVFIAAARSLGVPARFISGYRLDDVLDDGADAWTDGLRGWAETHVEGLGWVAFDPEANLCPTDRHIRIALGVDALSAAPRRGARHGFGEETRELDLLLDQSGRQTQG